jgi:hypothetical protein
MISYFLAKNGRKNLTSFFVNWTFCKTTVEIKSALWRQLRRLKSTWACQYSSLYPFVIIAWNEHNCFSAFCAKMFTNFCPNCISIVVELTDITVFRRIGLFLRNVFAEGYCLWENKSCKLFYGWCIMGILFMVL